MSLFLFVSCASQGKIAVVPGEQDEMRALETVWGQLGVATESGNPTLFTSHLTQESADWLEDLVEEIERMSEESIRSRPFHEAFLVLGARFLYRNREIDSYHYDNVVAATLKERPLRGLFNRDDLGDFWYENDEAWRGLARAGSVPLFFFNRENGVWKLNLLKTLPVVMRGLEAVSAKKKLSTADAVLYLLDMHLKYKADESLLQP